MHNIVSPSRPLGPDTPHARHRAIDARHVIIGGCERHPLEANGVYRVAQQLVREQRHAGADAQLVYLRLGTTEPAQRGDRITKVLPAVGRRFAGRLVRLDPFTVEMLTEGAGRNTLFHVHGAREPTLLSLTNQFHRRNIPYVVTIHGRYSHVFDQQGGTVKPITAAYLWLIERHVLQRAQFVHVVSAAERAIVSRIAPRARLELLPNAAYSSRLDGMPLLPRRIGPSLRFPTFGYCGRYEIEHKGLDLLIAGFALYRRAGGKGALELVGTGPAREQLLALAARNAVMDAVKIGPALFGADKNTALRKWDYFIMPSRYDGVPLGAIEAALQGLPLIVSTPTSLDELVLGHGSGFPISELTPQGVAEALSKAAVVQPGAWSRMSLASFHMALATGDWSTTASRLLDLYNLRRTQAEFSQPSRG